MPVSTREIVIDLPHIRLAGLQFGEATPSVIALHGWLDNAASFAPLAEELVTDSRSILALDFAGHGHSAHRPLGSGYHFTDYLLDVMMAADQLGMVRFDLLCHSMGGALGPMIAGSFPERVNRLVCIELYGAGMISDHESIPDRIRRSLLELDYQNTRPEKPHPDLQALIRARRQAGEMRPENARALLLRNTSLSKDGYRFLSDKRLRHWQPAVLSEEQMQSFIRRITAPVLMIEGAQGFTPAWEFLPPRYRLTQTIQVKRLPGGHHLHMDDPKVVGAAILNFWAEHPEE